MLRNYRMPTLRDKIEKAVEADMKTTAKTKVEKNVVEPKKTIKRKKKNEKSK